MHNILLPPLLFSLLSSLSYPLMANNNNNLWADMPSRELAARDSSSSALKQRFLTLDEQGFSQRLTETEQQAQTLSMQLPLPEGGFVAVHLTKANLLAPEIAKQHPQMKTWRITTTEADSPVLSGRAELTTLGFHAMLTLKNGDTLFIQPQKNTTAARDSAHSTPLTAQSQTRTYRSLSKRQNPQAFQRDFQCKTHQAPLVSQDSFSFANNNAIQQRLLAARAGEQLRTYDIAIATSGEFTAYHNGSRTDALSSIITTLNRVNEVYQRDLSLQLRLVSGTDVIHEKADTDPYPDADNNLGALLDINQTVLDQKIGQNRYDIGHLFTQSTGGIAAVAVACNNAYKAQGLSGWQFPEGDYFAVDFVAHEIGHQLGATHTFNGLEGNCDRFNYVAQTAYEPGSGSTIMSYAGLCSSSATNDNLQNRSDAMFHSASIAQIKAFAHEGRGNACGTLSNLDNLNPSVDAGNDYTIPAGTPFVLSGSANDQNSNDTLTYSWEQYNKGTASNVDVDTGNNALIRTYLPTPQAERSIPRLAELISGQINRGETLPSTSRFLDFRLQVRDGQGGTAYDDMKVTVQETGEAFAVTQPTGTNLSAGNAIDVTWNVANTDTAPIFCNKVDIDITTDGGQTFQNLSRDTDNDGHATVTLPAQLGEANHLRVKCRNNIFFALSATNGLNAETVTPENGSGNNNDGDDNGGGGSLHWLLLTALLAGLIRRKPALTNRPN